MGKRKEDPRRDDSSSISSDAKRRSRCRHYLYGEKKEETPSRDVLRVKLSIEEKFKRKFQKLKEKRKKDKNKHNEELRILKEDFRILKESHEDLKSKFHEMRKEGSAEVDQYKESPSQRSQLSQSTRFRLVIENSVSRTIYKNETVETEDGGGHIKVVMYDGGNPIAPDHPLASVKVELVVIEGRFNDKRGSWSKEEFEKSIITPREGMIRLVKNGTFDLIGGSCDHPGVIIMDNSQKKEVKLGVMIAVRREERVLEGVSNPFKVQEGKTKRSQKKGKQTAHPVRTPILRQSTSAYSTLQHGQRPANPFHQHSLAPPLQKAEDYRLSYPPSTVPLITEGNGQDLNGNGQKSSQQIPAQILEQSTSAYSIQHGQVYSCAPPSIQNQLQAEVYCPVNQPLLSCGQDQFTSFPNGSSELAYENPSMYASLNDTQSTFSPGDVRFPNVQTQMQDTFDWSFICGRVLLQWDNPHVKISERWNFLDQLMPLYITKSRFYGESFPTTSLIDKTHKLLGSIPSVGSVWKKKMASVTSRAMQTPQKRSVLIRPIEPYDSDDKPPFKKQRNARYQLRFVNTVCTDYYTREKIKSEDGTFLKVALYDENNLVVTSGPLSSASVEVILLHGDFNAEGQDYWTSEEFNTCLVHPQSAEEPPALGGDRVLALSDGEADLGNVNFQTSSFHARTGKFKMGAVIKNIREDNVQEGITSPFVVRVRLGEDHIYTTIFPPAILDSSICWNTNHNQLQQLASNNITTTPPAGSSGGGGSNNHPHPLSQNGSMATATGGGGGEGGGGVSEGDGDGGPNKPMLMPERKQLTPVPQPKSVLNCPRCNSSNTKFCYFNNYSLTQPRHFCHACRRYWTRGGALRNVPVSGGYRRHAKRSTKPKATAARAAAAAGGTSSATSTTPSSATTCTGSATATVPPGMHYSMFSNSAPPHGRFADGFDPASLGLSFPTRLLFSENGANAADGNGHPHQGVSTAPMSPSTFRRPRR